MNKKKIELKDFVEPIKNGDIVRILKNISDKINYYYDNKQLKSPNIELAKKLEGRIFKVIMVTENIITLKDIKKEEAELVNVHSISDKFFIKASFDEVNEYKKIENEEKENSQIKEDDKVAFSISGVIFLDRKTATEDLAPLLDLCKDNKNNIQIKMDLANGIPS